MNSKIVAIMIISGALIFPSRTPAEERDPFVSIIDIEKERATLKKGKIDLSRLTLQGIIRSDTDAVAIINEELFRVGEDLGAYKIERIDKDSITLDYEGTPYQVYLEGASDKQKERSVKDEK